MRPPHRRFIVSLVMALLLVPGLVKGQAPLQLGPPDATLQAELERSVQRQGLRHLVDVGAFAVALVDLSSDEPRYAAVNGDEMMYAASLPKIGILLGAFEAMQKGAIADTPALRGDLNRMIRVSDNAAATEVLDQVGFDRVAATLSDPSNELYEADGAGGIWVGKAYGRDETWQRDPVGHLSHGATARQVARFLVMLDRGELVSPAASRQMKAILGNPGIRHKFVLGLDQRPGARIFRKSGTWHDYHADAALVERDGCRYVAVGLVHDADGERILQRLIVELDDIVRGGPHAVASDQR